ncbi:hypothetical protein [Marivita sp. GX14005]|uniref:hypothetical protein n=1 Tax=Marivita sp. GX14005 TaxID=2942276 RepID=UPI002019B527|nr:hypothetical protein [Marivita sp. GX14005]MCL3883529.1 hypothetical protein [Marivita sp. GX14005]
MSVMAGAENLLKNCAELQRGERLLIAYEPEGHGYFEGGVRAGVAQAAQRMGAQVTLFDVGFSPIATALPPELLARMEEADVVVFLARLGDQLRFAEMPEHPRIVVSFAVSCDMLGSPFATLSHGAMLRLRDCVTAALDAAAEVHLGCPRGTDCRGRPVMPPAESGGTTLRRFPMSVSKPVPALSFSGRIAPCGFLIGTGADFYTPYSVEFDGRLLAIMENGRLLGFEGEAGDVAAANAQYDRVAERFGIDRNAIHSWHAGIHPACAYREPARKNYECWGGLAFGNPRILHFHSCGAFAPGEISLNVLDPTIEIDGVAIWESGRLCPERLPGGAALLSDHPDLARLVADPDRRVGL